MIWILEDKNFTMLYTYNIAAMLQFPKYDGMPRGIAILGVTDHCDTMLL